MIVGGYSLDLYCDCISQAHRFEEFPHQFYAETGGNAREQARRKGWRLYPSGHAACPECAAAGIKPDMAQRPWTTQAAPHPKEEKE